MAKDASNKRKTRKTTAPRKSAEPTAPLAVTAAGEWTSKAASADDAEAIPLPSGNVARVRRVGPEAFMEQGIIPDALTPMVDKAIQTKRGVKPKEVANLAKDPKKLGAMLEMMDRTVCAAVVEPKVSMPPVCVQCHEPNTTSVEEHADEDHEDYHDFTPEERKDGVLYVDRVDLEDKVFIMNFAMGSSADLQRFRAEHGAAMASVAAQQESSDEAK